MSHQNPNFTTFKHGEARTSSTQSPEYRTWCTIKRRCLVPTYKDYPRYGGKGLKIQEEWIENYAAFLEYMGRKPTAIHSIDRIDNRIGYVVGNVRWATPTEQQRNRTCNVRVTFRGKSMCISEWAEELDMEMCTLWSRLRVQGWSVEKALTTPVRKWPSQKKTTPTTSV